MGRGGLNRNSIEITIPKIEIEHHFIGFGLFLRLFMRKYSYPTIKTSRNEQATDMYCKVS